MEFDLVLLLRFEDFVTALILLFRTFLKHQSSESLLTNVLSSHIGLDTTLGLSSSKFCRICSEQNFKIIILLHSKWKIGCLKCILLTQSQDVSLSDCPISIYNIYFPLNNILDQVCRYLRLFKVIDGGRSTSLFFRLPL